MTDQLSSLYTEYSPLVFRRCRSILKNPDEAWDGVQEVFSKLVGQEKVVAGMTSPTAYLWRMATNYSLNRLKRERRSVSPPEGDVAALENRHEESNLKKIFLESLFSKVSTRTRELAWYRWVDGLTWEETALASGLSVSGVRKHLSQFAGHAKAYKEHV